ncbi:hypothetical protein GCM10018966_086570 [Streptomyces yanii]
MMSSHMMDSSPCGGWAADHAVSIVEPDGEALPVADVVRTARGAARPVPASLGHAVLSGGVEEQASFASPAVRRTLRVCGAYRQVVACELVSAVRALRLRDLRPDPGLPIGRAFGLADSLLEGEFADRPLADDVKVAAGELLDRCTDLWNTDLTSTSTRGTA